MSQWKEHAIELSKTVNGLRYIHMTKILNEKFNLDLTVDEVKTYVQTTRGLKDRSNEYKRKNSTETKKEEKKGNKVGEKRGQKERKPEIDDKGDYYLITREDGKSTTITKERLREFKILYCEQKMTINQVSRRMEISRSNIILIKTAFGITHDDVPYIDDDMYQISTEDLVVESLERKKEKYFIKLQEKEIVQMKSELDKYRQEDYFYNKLIDANEKFFTEFSQSYKGPDFSIKTVESTGKMLEVSIVDLHLSKLAWAPETGENYDRKIAEERFMYVIDDIIERTKHIKFEKIIFPCGNDFFNFDTISGTTTNGTRQDNDSRWQKMYLLGVELLIKGIDKLKEGLQTHVEVFLVPGNHDSMTSFYAVHDVHSWFRNDPMVTVNYNPKTRKYIEFGNCLIGFSHSDKEKKRIFGNMQTEVPAAWGRTKYREWHAAHLHSEQVKEEFGVKVRNLSSVTSTDAWHASEGYVGAIACSQTFIWDSKRGLENILYTTIEKEEDLDYETI